MYAIIEVGGKQQIVKKGDSLLVEKQEVEQGKEIIFDKVLLVASDAKLEVGQPYIKGASVIATLLKQTKGAKVISFKYRRRKASHTKKGHRQKLSEIQIKEIKA